MFLVQSGKSQGSGDSVPRSWRWNCVGYGPEIAVSCRVALRMLMRRDLVDLVVRVPVDPAAAVIGYHHGRSVAHLVVHVAVLMLPIVRPIVKD